MRELENISVLSLDLFDTLVRVRGFDQRLAFKSCHKVLTDKGIKIDFNAFFNAYRKKIRHYLTHRLATGTDFKNDLLVLELLKELLKQTISVDLKLARAVVDTYFKSLVTYTIPFPNMETTLRRLKEEQYILILTSNHSWPEHGYKILERVGIKHLFTRIIFSGDLGKAKPHPAIFEEALKEIPDKNSVLHIGDNPFTDIDGAQKFGIHSLWVHSRNHYRKRKLILPTINERLVGEIRDITELPSFLGLNFDGS